MRFRSHVRLRLGAAALASAWLAVGGALAAPPAVKSALEARLRQQLPGIGASGYALGAAAFDPQLRAKVEAGGEASTALLKRGAALWKRKFRDGRSLASCFPNGGRRVAVAYPQYHWRSKRVFTLEMAVNQCLKTHHEPLLEYDDPQTMGIITAYVRSLSNGYPVRIRVPRAAEPHFEQGQRLYFSRLGQRNFACASCHVQAAGRRYAGTPLSPAIGQAVRWPFIRGAVPVTLQAQIRECLERMGAAPFAAGSEELNDLEYFLTYLSNGLPVKANAWRPVPR